jgi:acetoin utilization deacetylase AcuC-like enzyme
MESHASKVADETIYPQGNLESRTGHLDDILGRFAPDLVFYLAGVDPALGDRYGRLALSDKGLALRERHVLETCRSLGLPVVVTIAGGYAPTPARTAELHSIVFREARRIVEAARSVSASCQGPPAGRS